MRVTHAPGDIQITFTCSGPPLFIPARHTSEWVMCHFRNDVLCCFDSFLSFHSTHFMCWPYRQIWGRHCFQNFLGNSNNCAGEYLLSALVCFKCLEEALPQSGATSHISEIKGRNGRITPIPSLTHIHTHIIDQRKEADVRPSRPIHNLSLCHSFSLHCACQASDNLS